MNPLHQYIRWFALALAALAWACDSAAQASAVLTDTGLGPQRIELLSYTPEGIGFLDWQGNRQTLPLDRVLGLTLAGRGGYDAPAGVAEFELRDGQVLVGQLLGPGADGGSVRVGAVMPEVEIELSLDDLMEIRFVPASTGVREDDAVLLATGETLTGFIEAFADGAIDFIVGDADEPIRIPLDRIHAVSVANSGVTPRPGPGQTLTRVRMISGARIHLIDASLQLESDASDNRMVGQPTLEIGDDRLQLPFNQVAGIDNLSGVNTLSPLTGIDYEIVSGGEVFGVPMPPRVVEPGWIRLHAPTELSFDLPDGATRLAFEVGMDLPLSITPDRRALAGCELIVTQAGEELGSYELSPNAQPQRINLPVSGGPLRLDLRPGVNGPVLDRVRITGAQLLISQP